MGISPVAGCADCEKLAAGMNQHTYAWADSIAQEHAQHREPVANCPDCAAGLCKKGYK